MKRIKITTIIILILVMCLTMAFPVSAIDVIDDYGYMSFIQEKIIELKTRTGVFSTLPAGCDYYMVGINYTGCDITLDKVTSTSTVYFYIGNNANLNYSPSSSNYYVSFARKANGTYTESLSKLSTATYSANFSTGNYGFYINYGNGGDARKLHWITGVSNASFSNYNNIKTYASSLGYDFEVTLNPAVPPIDISALQSLISQAKAIQNTNYTQSSWNALQSQITSAENLLATTGYTQTQIDNAKNALQAAIDGLVTLPDTTELEALVEIADTIQDDGYAKPTWNRFTTARTSAHVLLASPIYTAPQVSSTTTELRTSMDSLRLLPDASALRDLIETARTYIDDKYTELSLEILNSKIMQSLILLDNEDYVAAQIDNAMSELWNAILGLVIKDKEPEYEKPPNIIVDGVEWYSLNGEQIKYTGLENGVQAKHLEPVKETVSENMGVARKYGYWVWFLVLAPMVIVIILRGFIGSMGSGIDIDMTPNRGDSIRPSVWRRNERSGKYWEQIR